MARSAPIVDSGNIPSGSGNRATFMNTLVAKLTEFQSGGTDAWELTNQFDVGASYDGVFHSVGDRTIAGGSGDTDIWIRLRMSSGTVYVQGAQDFSTIAASWTAGRYREINSSGTGSIDDTTAIDWFSVVNEYEFHFVWLQGGAWHSLSLGSLIRPYSDAIGGVGRITSQSGTGNGVVLGIDRDLTNDIQVGQKVWLVNQTPDGSALQSVGIDIVTVTAKTASTLTVDGVTNTYAVGSLVGWDPCPTFVKPSTSTTVCFGQKLDGSWSSSNGQIGYIHNIIDNVGITESDFDPGLDGLYAGGDCGVVMNSYPQGYRGKFQLVQIFTLGTQTDMDLMQVNFDATQQYKVLTSSGASWFSSYATGFGPGVF